VASCPSASRFSRVFPRETNLPCASVPHKFRRSKALSEKYFGNIGPLALASNSSPRPGQLSPRGEPRLPCVFRCGSEDVTESGVRCSETGHCVSVRLPCCRRLEHCSKAHRCAPHKLQRCSRQLRAAGSGLRAQDTPSWGTSGLVDQGVDVIISTTYPPQVPVTVRIKLILLGGGPRMSLA